MDGPELVEFAAHDLSDWTSVDRSNRPTPVPTVRDGWVAYLPLGGGQEAAGPLAPLQVIDEVALGSVLVIRFSWSR